MGRETSTRQQAAAFMRLFSLHAREIYVYIQVLLHDDAAAEDAFQDVSLQLWEDFPKYRHSTNFYAWAKQVAYYKVLQHQTRRQRERRCFSALLDTRLATDLERWAGELGAQRRALAACVDRLPAEDRELIEQRYSPQATVQLMAEQLGRSADALYRSLRRIHRRLFRCVTHTLQHEEWA